MSISTHCKVTGLSTPAPNACWESAAPLRTSREKPDELVFLWYRRLNNAEDVLSPSKRRQQIGIFFLVGVRFYFVEATTGCHVA